MGRPERSIEQPEGELGRFAADLRQLRETAGRPTYEAMARRTGVSRAALAKAAAGGQLPRWRTVECYVRDCRGDVEVWRTRWEVVSAAERQPADDAVAPAHDVGQSVPEPNATRTPSWRRRRALVMAIVAIGLVVLIGAWLTVRVDDPGALPSLSEQPIFAEDFDGAQLNLQRWIAPSDPAYLYPRDNVLNLVAGGVANGEVSIDLTAQDIGPFREIDFVTSALSAPRPGSGGGSLILTEQSGRTQKLIFGVSPGEVPLSVALLACTRPTCITYDDYVPPVPPSSAQQYTFGEVVSIKVFHTQGQLRVYMRDILIAQTMIDGPLTNFRFNGYASGDEQWHLTVDAVRVYR